MAKRVLLIHNTLWTHYKGSVFSELHLLLKEYNISVFVVQQAATENMRKSLGGVDLSSHKYPYILLSNKSLNSIPASMRVLQIITQIINSKATIVVIPGYADIAYWFALLSAKLMGKKCIISFDSTESDRPRRVILEVLKKMFVRCFDMGFCYGSMSNKYLSKLGMAQKRIIVRCQATDHVTIKSIHQEAYSGRSNTIRQHGFSRHNFVYVGRLSREKNIKTLLFAFAELKKRVSESKDWGMLIVGTGPDAEELASVISENNIMGVHMLGGMSWKEVPKFLALSDVLVLPSYSEPWGLVVNEAMCCGMPVIVSNKCGAAHDIVVNGQNGFIFDPSDQADLADKMSYFILNSDRIADMGSCSMEIIADYTPLHAAEQMTNGILKLLYS